MTEPAATDADASSDPIDAIRGYYGARTQTSDWYTVTQEMVDQFGAATGDSEWIHCDPERPPRKPVRRHDRARLLDVVDSRAPFAVEYTDRLPAGRPVWH